MRLYAKFPIGQSFKTRGKGQRYCRVVDILKTYNCAGTLVKVRYVAEHEFMGQTIRDEDVCETTISMGLE